MEFFDIFEEQVLAVIVLGSPSPQIQCSAFKTFIAVQDRGIVRPQTF